MKFEEAKAIEFNIVRDFYWKLIDAMGNKTELLRQICREMA